MMYYKITNTNENNNGFQFVDGLNILNNDFNKTTKSCCYDGFYFTDITNIFKFLDCGIYLREVTLPTENSNFKMIKDKSDDKWIANMFILGKCHNLFTIETFKYSIENRADIHANNDLAL